MHIRSVQYYICKLFDMFVEKSTTLPSFPNFIELAVKGIYHMKDGKWGNWNSRKTGAGTEHGNGNLHKLLLFIRFYTSEVHKTV